VLVLLAVGFFVLRKLSAATDAAIKHALKEPLKEAGAVADRVDNVRGLAEDSMAQMQQVAALLTLITLVQMTGILVAIDFGWPIEVKWFSGIIDHVASLDLTGVAAPECTMAMTGYQRSLLTLFVPVAALILLAVLIGAFTIMRRCSCAKTMERAASWCNNKAIGIFLFTYVLIVGSALSPFDCVESAAAGTSFMRELPDRECDVGKEGFDVVGGSYGLLHDIGIASLIVCCLAIVIIGVELYRARRNSSLHTDERTMREYGTLYLRYDEQHYYWEVLILVRKLLLVVILRVPMSQWAKVGGCGVILGGALALQHCHKPFLSDALDQLEERTLLVCLATVGLGICSLLGVPPIAVTVIYFLLVGAAVLYIAPSLRAVWREDTKAATGAGQQLAAASATEGSTEGGGAVI
jgi:hypothetical protein